MDFKIDKERLETLLSPIDSPADAAARIDGLSILVKDLKEQYQNHLQGCFQNKIKPLIGKCYSRKDPYSGPAVGKILGFPESVSHVVVTNVPVLEFSTLDNSYNEDDYIRFTTLPAHFFLEDYYVRTENFKWISQEEFVKVGHQYLDLVKELVNKSPDEWSKPALDFVNGCLTTTLFAQF